MTDTFVYNQDPGLAVLTGNGSVRNIVKEADVPTVPAFGAGVLGLIGSVVNDRGAPSVPVVLDSTTELSVNWGGFKTWLGDGPSSGYNGNLFANATRLPAPRVVLIPVDMSLRDKTITDASALEVKAKLRRALSITGEADTELFTTDRDHKFAAGDTVSFPTKTGGAEIVVDTVYYVIASGLTATTFKVSATEGGSAVDFTTDITAGLVVPIAAAGYDLAPYVLPAGTRIKASGGFTIATLEPVSWDEDDTTEKTVRVQHVTGTAASLATVTIFVDDNDDDDLVMVTTTTGTPFQIDAAEIALRYAYSAQKMNSNPAGLSVNVAASDRTDAAVINALSGVCADHFDTGFLWFFVWAPPVGTTPTNAQGTGTNGAQRAGIISPENTAGIFPDWVRPFLEDKTNLVGPEYLARFAGAIPMAAAISVVLPEENPARASEVIKRWGAVGIGQSLTRAQKIANFKAGLCTPEFRLVRGRGNMPAHRDGITPAGTKIANERLWAYLAQGISMAIEPFHQAVATLDAREDMRDNADQWLGSLQKPKDGSPGRIAGRTVDVLWDSDNEMATLINVVRRNGNMDIMTVRLNLTSDNIIPVRE